MGGSNVVSRFGLAAAFAKSLPWTRRWRTMLDRAAKRASQLGKSHLNARWAQGRSKRATGSCWWRRRTFGAGVRVPMGFERASSALGIVSVRQKVVQQAHEQRAW